MTKPSKIFLETKSMVSSKTNSNEFLRKVLNKDYDSLSAEEQKKLNLMARWEFAKPLKLRIPARALMDFLKAIITPFTHNISIRILQP